MASRKGHLPLDLLEHARNMRRESTKPEWLLWELVRDRRLGGLKFRRQLPFPPLILDFHCHEKRLVVEIDGASHNDRGEEHRRRQSDLERHGLRILRVGNDDVIRGLEAVARAILRAAGMNAE